MLFPETSAAAHLVERPLDERHLLVQPLNVRPRVHSVRQRQLVRIQQTGKDDHVKRVRNGLAARPVAYLGGINIEDGIGQKQRYVTWFLGMFGKF